MTTTLTPRGQQLLLAVRRNFELLGELEKSAPGDVDFIVGAIVGHVRSWKPMALAAPEPIP